MKSISSKDLLSIYIHDNNCLIIDIRHPLDYAKGHIPKSFNIPFDTLIKKSILYLNKDYSYYIICKSGSKSKTACNILSKNNYTVININDGIEAWIGPIEKDRVFN